jgi:iron complex outermembrane receptor protein
LIFNAFILGFIFANTVSIYKTTTTAKDLAPSINDGWEVGIKARSAKWAEGRVAYWQQSATNEWRRQLNNLNGDSINIGVTDRQGVDIEVKVSPIQPLSVWTTFSLQEAVIKTPALLLHNIKVMRLTTRLIICFQQA